MTTELDTTTAQKINELHQGLTVLLHLGIEKAVEIGELLTAKKAELKHGEFGAWIKDNLVFTDRSARNYMKLYDNRDKVLEARNISEAYKMLEAHDENGNVSDLEHDRLNDNPARVYGRVNEFLHVAGYNMARAKGMFEWLLKENKWKSLKFSDINDFLNSFDYSQLTWYGNGERKIIKELLQNASASEQKINDVLGSSKKPTTEELFKNGNLFDFAEMLPTSGRMSVITTDSPMCEDLYIFGHDEPGYFRMIWFEKDSFGNLTCIGTKRGLNKEGTLIQLERLLSNIKNISHLTMTEDDEIKKTFFSMIA